MRKRLFLFSLLLCITAGFGQGKLKKADRLFADYAYVDAAKEYEKYLSERLSELLNSALLNRVSPKKRR